MPPLSNIPPNQKRNNNHFTTFYHNIVITAFSSTPLYLGCYIDSEDYRTFADNHYADTSAYTREKCFQHCRTNNKRYVAMQSGKDCWCGANDVAYDIHGKVPEAECDMACTGDPSTMCGGTYRNSVFDLQGKKGFMTWKRRATLSTMATLIFTWKIWA